MKKVAQYTNKLLIEYIRRTVLAKSDFFFVEDKKTVWIPLCESKHFVFSDKYSWYMCLKTNQNSTRVPYLSFYYNKFTVGTVLLRGIAMCLNNNTEVAQAVEDIILNYKAYMYNHGVPWEEI